MVKKNLIQEHAIVRKAIEDESLDDVDLRDLIYTSEVPDDDQQLRTPTLSDSEALMVLDEKVNVLYAKYLKQLKRLKLTDTLWIVDTRAGHA